MNRATTPESTMNNTTTRTPTRFSIGSTPTTIVSTGTNGQTIVVAVTETLGATHSYGQMCADARFIVRACNAHEKLTAALREIAAISKPRMCMDGSAKVGSPNATGYDFQLIARAALAAAGVEP